MSALQRRPDNTRGIGKNSLVGDFSPGFHEVGKHPGHAAVGNKIGDGVGNSVVRPRPRRSRYKVSHGVFMGQIGREADIHHHLQHDLAQLPQFLDFLGFGGVIVAGYDLLLRVPKAIFLGNGDNLTNLIYVKVPPVP